MFSSIPIHRFIVFDRIISSLIKNSQYSATKSLEFTHFGERSNEKPANKRSIRESYIYIYIGRVYFAARCQARRWQGKLNWSSQQLVNCAAFTRLRFAVPGALMQYRNTTRRRGLGAPYAPHARQNKLDT